MSPILSRRLDGANHHLSHMDRVLEEFCRTGRLGEPEPLRPRVVSLAAEVWPALSLDNTRAAADTRSRVRAAVVAYRAKQAREPLALTAAWLREELPGLLVTLDEAAEIVAFTVAKAGARMPLTNTEARLVTTWERFVAERREEQAHCRAEGGTRG